MSVPALQREVKCIVPAVVGHCYVCGVHGPHNHFDTALHDLVCVCCWIPLRVAEDVCAELFFNAGPLRDRELQERIDDFELSGARGEVFYIWRPVR